MVTNNEEVAEFMKTKLSSIHSWSTLKNERDKESKDRMRRPKKKTVWGRETDTWLEPLGSAACLKGCCGAANAGHEERNNNEKKCMEDLIAEFGKRRAYIAKLGRGQPRIWRSISANSSHEKIPWVYRKVAMVGSKNSNLSTFCFQGLVFVLFFWSRELVEMDYMIIDCFRM